MRISVFVALLLLVAASHGKGVAQEFIEAITKSGGKEATQELAEFGGKQAVQEVLEKASLEGGDELVERVIWYGKKYGVPAVKAIGNSPTLYIKALDELPESLVERALWAVQRESETVTRLLSQYGSGALLVAARFRGVGTDIVTKLGDDGIRMGRDLTEDQAITLARHADDIAKLPASQRSQVVNAIMSAPNRVIEYMEKHSRVFGTAAGIATLVTLKDEVLGKDEEVIINPDGSKVTRKRGIIERLLDSILDKFNTPLLAIFVMVAIVVGGLGGVKIWGAFQRERARITRAEKRSECEARDSSVENTDR